MALIRPKNIPTANLSDGTSFLQDMPAGSIIQAKQSVRTSPYVTTSASFVFPDNLSIDITPSSASSQFVITPNLWVASTRWTSVITLQRNGVDIGLADPAGNRNTSFLNWNMDYTMLTTHGYQHHVTGTLIDSPNTTGTITYRIGVKRRADNEGGDADARINYGVNDRDTTSYDQRHISSITVYEIKQ